MDVNSINTDDFGDLSHDEIVKPLISNPEGNYIQNRDILIKLSAEIKRLNRAYAVTGFASVASLATAAYPVLAALSLTAAGYTIELITRLERLHLVTKMLLDRFEDEGITITLRVQTNLAIIDLFVKMPDKRPFALLLRNNGNGAVRWREDKQEFFIHKVGKKACKWGGMTRTAGMLKSTIYLKDLKSPLLGTSRTERTRTITKAVVLCGKTTIYPSHPPEYWVDFGRTKVLKVYKDNVFYVIEQEHLVNFLLPPEK